MSPDVMPMVFGPTCWFLTAAVIWKSARAEAGTFSTENAGCHWGRKLKGTLLDVSKHQTVIELSSPNRGEEMTRWQLSSQLPVLGY